MDKTQKQQFVTSLKQSLGESGLVLITKQSGLTVAEVTELRHKMRQAGAKYKVAKNTLAKLAVKGTDFEGLGEHFIGPTAIAFSIDPIGAAKAAVDFAKTNEKLKIVAGQMGSKFLKEDDIKALASLPSLDELRATLICIVQTPATRIAGVTQAPAGQLARVIGAYGAKG